MNAVELISTGEELLGGYGLNTHARALGGALRPLGWRLVRDTTIGDDADVLVSCVRGALRRAPVVVVTGGLGPTPDDVTVDAVAAMLGRVVRLDHAAVALIHARCRERGIASTPSRDRQARVVDGAEVFQNPVGMAPGQLLRVRARRLFLLPGPPSEFDAVLQGFVLPRLTPAPCERLAVLGLCGLGEAEVCDRLAAAGLPASGVRAGYRARPDCLELRLQAPAAEAASFDATVAKVRQLLHPAVFTARGETLEEVVTGYLRQQGKTLAVAESCTGGLLGARLTSVPGVSACFKGGVIAYDDDLKINLLGVPGTLLAERGAVSAETAASMAEGVRRICRSDYGLALTGIAGPGGAAPGKPVGLVYLALAASDGTMVRSRRGGGTRDRVREQASSTALDMLRRRLLPAELRAQDGRCP